MSFALVSRRSGLSVGRQMVRFESTSTTQKATEAAKQAASKASSTASEYTAKASQGLSRVSSAAGPAIANAAKGVSGALGRVGGRTGRLIAFIERMHHSPLPCGRLAPCLFCMRSVVAGRQLPIWWTKAILTSSPIGQVPFVVYYSKVGIELSKIVFKGQNMTPP